MSAARACSLAGPAGIYFQAGSAYDRSCQSRFAGELSGCAQVFHHDYPSDPRPLRNLANRSYTRIRLNIWIVAGRLSTDLTKPGSPCSACIFHATGYSLATIGTPAPIPFSIVRYKPLETLLMVQPLPRGASSHYNRYSADRDFPMLLGLGLTC
jgi:hypothetical protein